MTKLLYILCLVTTISCGAQSVSTNTAQAHSIENDSLSEDIKGQLQTFKNLRTYLKEKKYDDVISLYTLEIQYFLKLMKEDKERFKTWYQAWTYDEATYEKYVEKIKNGAGVNIFKLEEGEWRIDQK